MAKESTIRQVGHITGIPIHQFEGYWNFHQEIANARTGGAHIRAGVHVNLSTIYFSIERDGELRNFAVRMQDILDAFARFLEEQEGGGE